MAVTADNFQGKLLISQPVANSNFFSQTVVLICEHHAKGAWGLVLTKPSPVMTVDTLGRDIGIPVHTNEPLYIGGPVQDDGLHFLHTPDVIVSHTMHIAPNLCVTSSEAMLREIQEEVGNEHPKILKHIPLEMFISNDTKFQYHTFVCVVKSEFIPRLNGEHNGYAWVSVGAWPKPLHQGVKSSLEKSTTKNKLQTILDILY